MLALKIRNFLMCDLYFQFMILFYFILFFIDLNIMTKPIKKKQ